MPVNTAVRQSNGPVFLTAKSTSHTATVVGADLLCPYPSITRRTLSTVIEKYAPPASRSSCVYDRVLLLSVLEGAGVGVGMVTAFDFADSSAAGVGVGMATVLDFADSSAASVGVGVAMVTGLDFASSSATGVGVGVGMVTVLDFANSSTTGVGVGVVTVPNFASSSTTTLRTNRSSAEDSIRLPVIEKAG